MNFKTMNRKTLVLFLSVLTSVFCLGGIWGCLPAHAAQEQLLDSWNAGDSKTAITEFVQKVTGEIGGNPVSIEERIAVFDNDGTLWTERPHYFQEDFINNYSPPSKGKFSLRSKMTKKAKEEKVIGIDTNNDGTVDITSDEVKAALETAAVFDGITTDEFLIEARDFLDNYDHPDYNAKYIELTYEPVIDLVEYLQANDFQVYICSGGGRDFVRSFAEDAYGIAPENTIGSSVRTQFVDNGAGGELIRLPMLGQYNDQQGKPVGIERQIGKRPIMAVGNSSGDLEMFQYTDDGQGANSDSLIVLINHDDCDREYRYNYNANNDSLDAANQQGHENWIVASMKDDFNNIFNSQLSRDPSGNYCIDS